MTEVPSGHPDNRRRRQSGEFFDPFVSFDEIFDAMDERQRVLRENIRQSTRRLFHDLYENAQQAWERFTEFLETHETTPEESERLINNAWDTMFLVPEVQSKVAEYKKDYPDKPLKINATFARSDSTFVLYYQEENSKKRDFTLLEMPLQESDKKVSELTVRDLMPKNYVYIVHDPERDLYREYTHFTSFAPIEEAVSPLNQYFASLRKRFSPIEFPATFPQQKAA